MIIGEEEEEATMGISESGLITTAGNSKEATEETIRCRIEAE